MKKLLFSGLLAFSLFATYSCGSDDSNQEKQLPSCDKDGDGIQDAAISLDKATLQALDFNTKNYLDANTVSDTIKISGATKIDARMPTVSSTLELTSYDRQVVLLKDSVYELTLNTYDISDDISGVYLQVDNSNEYYKVASSFRARNSEVMELSIPIVINEKLGNGFFDIKYAVYDNLGNVSNKKTITVEYISELGIGSDQFLGDWSAVAEYSIDYEYENYNYSTVIPRLVQQDYYIARCYDSLQQVYTYDSIYYQHSTGIKDVEYEFNNNGTFEYSYEYSRVYNSNKDCTTSASDLSIVTDVFDWDNGFWYYESKTNSITLVTEIPRVSATPVNGEPVDPSDYEYIPPVYQTDIKKLFYDECGGVSIIQRDLFFNDTDPSNHFTVTVFR